MNNRRNQSNDRNSQGGNNRGKGGARGNSSSKPSSGKGKPTFGGKPSEEGKKSFGPKKPFNKPGEKPFVKRLKKAPVDDGTIRLNKYVANAGIASRREADELIKTGIVTVNGQVITEMGYKVQPDDEVRFDGRKISSEKNVYFVLNKPKGFISTSNDEKGRKTVMDLMSTATTARIFPVGRLDRQTTGVLLFTNDGYLTKKLTHPSHDIKKIYHVTLDKKLTANDLADIKKGVRLIPEGIAVVDEISFIEGRPKNEVGVELHIGWNRVVRRIFETKGYEVEALDRVSFAGLTKKTLQRGDFRRLTELEVNFLKML
ncbi:rRNA pseudouridine synthase [Empedobacter falsenii]|jgi:23S rRNA pseudouridine2605 synthase|uniref:Pseudouridine synthase n=1 Tax=Empedobacter falsenii TaxID=343874 RepID=A0A376FY44_9FLAO|nr:MULTISPECIES: pseudouridine synthase [Empedobacter]HAR73936.1 rRNA pseudouridine synthase [Flavobacteriaceae bacterium]MBW1619259.1 rRNA pseudouridine synthase [Empedobacter falsenii]MBY0065685.1 rRNA pseudouridine synthase [Empedobacter falsenii]MDH0658683.1 rRNA pseudouridine synthase [Empedobacter sp. GD03865]MDH0673455.1 rRNA pseudouridine synthase [Empedobacter sp. GD03861]